MKLLSLMIFRRKVPLNERPALKAPHLPLKTLARFWTFMRWEAKKLDSKLQRTQGNLTQGQRHANQNFKRLHPRNRNKLSINQSKL